LLLFSHLSDIINAKEHLKSMGLFDFFKKKKAPLPEAPKEHRLLPRWKISALAKIRLSAGATHVPCEVKDLNMKGCCLTLEQVLPDGCAEVELYFNEKYFFDVEIAIVWHKEIDNKHVYGIKFTRVRDADKEKMFQMMRENFSGQLWKNI
jgi:hypothetical protein